MTASIARGFTAVGLKVKLISVSHDNFSDIITSELSIKRYDAVFSFASFGSELKSPSGSSVFDQGDVIYIGWNVDHPCYHYQRVMAPVARRRTICANPSHFDFIDYLGGAGQGLALFARGRRRRRPRHRLSTTPTRCAPRGELVGANRKSGGLRRKEPQSTT